MWYFKITAVLVAALLTGFFGGLFLFDQNDQVWSPGKIFIQFEAIKKSHPKITFNKGWGYFDDGRLWLAENKGNLSISLPNKPRSDLLLSVTGDSVFTSGNEKKQINIMANGSLIGNLILTSQKPKIEDHILLIPQELAVKAKVMNVDFRLVPPGPGGMKLLSIKELSLMDIHQMANMRGHIDQCSTITVSGWAVSGQMVPPLIVRKNGKKVAMIQNFHDRKDLPTHGIPLNAGFTHYFQEPLQKGDHVELVFLNGKQVPGHKCNF